MRYRLRTLLIMLALGPPALAMAWSRYAAYRTEQERQRAIVAKFWIDPHSFPQDFTFYAQPCEATADSESGDGLYCCYGR